jgi:DNA-binding NarL/FixJ family response regulator
MLIEEKMLGETPSIILIAGNRLLRETLVRILNKRGAFNVCGVLSGVPDNESAFSAASEADVLILDPLSTRPLNYSFIASVIEKNPEIRVVMINMDDDPEVFLECVRAGAVGYLLKDASAAEVVSGVRAVLEGQAVCPRHLCLELFRVFSRQCVGIPNARIRLDLGLTRRQQQLIPLIAQGLTNKEIASQLSISEHTIKNHIHEIMRQLGADDRLQIVDLSNLSATFR